MLRTVDLFTGIGGITHALHGLATPIAYCDIASESQAVLTSLMERGLLPKASICKDVKKLDKQWIQNNNNNKNGNKIDMIVGGFPCVGFSNMGLRQAFENEGSGLFTEILRLADEIKCPMLFLENVPSVINMGMDHIVDELVTKRGYELRWTIASAEFVGAPHQRSRWFCLAIKPKFKFILNQQSKFDPYPWGKTTEPPRCLPKDDVSNKLRRGMLGNSVVPDAVRYAFLFLASRCTNTPTTLNTLVNFSIVPAISFSNTSNNFKHTNSLLPVETKKPKHTWHSNGIVTTTLDILKVVPLTPFRQQFRKKLIIDPKAFISETPPSKLLTSGVLTEPLIRHTWATPRHGAIGMCNYLTMRSCRDLETQIRFERSTPNKLRSGGANPVFIEYLMGYPKDWTLFD